MQEFLLLDMCFDTSAVRMPKSYHQLQHCANKDFFRKASQTLLVLGILDNDYRLIPSVGLVEVAQGHIFWNLRPA